MSHVHIVLEVGVVGDVRLREDQILLLPLGAQATAALLVQKSLLDGYGPAGAVGFPHRGGVVSAGFGNVVGRLALETRNSSITTTVVIPIVI